MEREIERELWDSFLREFTTRHETKRTTLQVLHDTCIEIEEEGMSLSGVDIEMRGADAPNLHFMLSADQDAAAGHLTHRLPSVAKIAVVLNDRGLETGLVVESHHGDRARLYLT